MEGKEGIYKKYCPSVRLTFKAGNYGNTFMGFLFIFGFGLFPNIVSSQETPDSGYIYYSTGVRYTRGYKFVEGREALLKAQQWFYREKDYHNFGSTLIQLGFQTNRLGYFDKSIEYFNRASEVADMENIPALLFHADVAKALTCLWEYQLTKDTLLLQKGYSLLSGLAKREYLGKDEVFNDYLEAWGDYYIKTGNRDSALYFYDLSLSISKKNSNHLSIANCYINRAWIALVENDLSKAFKNLDSAESTFIKERNLLHERRLHNLYYRSYKKRNEYKKALAHYMKSSLIKKKELLADRDLALSQLTHRFERAIIEEELHAKESILRYQKWLLLIISGILVLAVIFVIMYFRLYRDNKRISNKNSLLLKEQNHRLKNNLQIISGLLSLQANRLQEDTMRDIIEASQYRVNAIGLIHKQLYEQGVEEVELQQFANELINQIIVSFGILNLNRDINIDIISLPPDTVNSLGLILNELLTNSCKYAFQKTKEPNLVVKINLQEDGSIMLLYKDNGPGFNIKKAQGKSTFGLTLINIQVAQLEGKSRWKGTGGFTFTLVFRVEKRLSFRARMTGKRN